MLAIIRNNCYAVHQDFCSSKKDGHKLFTLSLTEDLVNKAYVLIVQYLARIPTTPRLQTLYPSTALWVSSSQLKSQITTGSKALTK
eukprot:10395011-Ditylum_brightwellii.AAC.1